ncbi:MAG: DUF3048 domain-containing protein [Lachnospiraceae bacterium]|nr:DUF3048 domain-containing protein [Lachnospiraceae bacterium]
MKKWNKANRYALLAGLLFFIVMLTFACKKKEKEDTKEVIAPTITAEVTKVPTDTPTLTEAIIIHEGEARSYLTGEWKAEEEVIKRPYAVIFNNIECASPQSGIGDAAILYEALVEGGITRMLGIFDGIDPDSETAKRIGSVRSARHYFASFADEYDAIFVHFGETTYATKAMKKLGIDHLTGSYGIGVNSFYRDPSIKSPHNAFTSLDGILKAVQNGDIRTEYEKGYESHFSFYEENTVPVSDVDVNKLTLKFSNYTSPYFMYDAENKVYLRSQFGSEHTDANTGEQLAFENIIVQFVKQWDIDKNGYQTMELADASGTGYYITNGKMVKVTWKKNESTRMMRYYDETGKELIINPGKTYIAVFPNHKTENVIME